jgi:hypothetical protein
MAVGDYWRSRVLVSRGVAPPGGSQLGRCGGAWGRRFKDWSEKVLGGVGDQRVLSFAFALSLDSLMRIWVCLCCGARVLAACDWVNCHVFEFFLGHTFNFDWCRLALFSFSIAREALLVPEIENYTSDVR